MPILGVTSVSDTVKFLSRQTLLLFSHHLWTVSDGGVIIQCGVILKCHLFKNSYPNSPDPLSTLPLNCICLNSCSASSDPLAIGPKSLIMDYPQQRSVISWRPALGI